MMGHNIADLSQRWEDTLEFHPAGDVVQGAKREEIQRALEHLSALLKHFDTLSASPELRPLLLAAVVHELGEIESDVDVDRMVRGSNILQLLHGQYRPVFMSEVIERFIDQYRSNSNPEAVLTYYRDFFQNHDELNSTLKNLLIAAEMNQGLLADSPHKAKVSLAHYSWREIASKTARGQLPDLPHGTADKTYYKFVIVIVDEQDHIVDVMDYGKAEFKEKYDRYATGEQRNIAGHLGESEALIDPLDMKAVIRGMKTIEQAQNTADDREAVRLMNLHEVAHRQLVDFMTPETAATFPHVIVDVNDLIQEGDESQLNEILGWAHQIKKMWAGKFEHVDAGDEQAIFRQIGSQGCIYSGFKGLQAMLEMSQPSTRTTTSAQQAFDALGLTIRMIAKSSDEKGEKSESKEHTLQTHGIAVHARRSAKNEEEAIGWRNEDKALYPAHISLGGNEFHPTQTIGEILIFMEHFGCSEFTLEELRERTRSNPPTVAFVSNTKNKRADKALMRFILQHLPDWKVLNLVADERFIPEIPDIEADHPQLTIKVVADLRNQELLKRELHGASILYTSNAEGTSGEGGKGDGKMKETPFFIGPEVLEGTDMLFLAPLPASEEIDQALLNHPNSRTSEQMQNKVATIISLTAHELQMQKVLRNERGLS